MPTHQIDAEGLKEFFRWADPVTYASDGDKKLEVHNPLYGEPRFVVRVKGEPVYDGWTLDDAVLAYNEN